MAEAYLRGLGLEGLPMRAVLLKNGNAADDLVPGDVVEYDVSSGEPVAVDGTAADPRTAGVVLGLRPIGGGLGGNIVKDAYGYIQVGGFCDYITTDNSIAAGDLLISGAAVADAGTLGTDDGAAFGVALQADSGTTLTAAILFGRG